MDNKGTSTHNKSDIEISFTPTLLKFVGYNDNKNTKKKQITNKKFHYLRKYIVPILAFLVILQSVLIPILYISFYFTGYKVLPIGVFATTILPFIISIIFIVLFSKLKRDFYLWQQKKLENNRTENNQTFELNIYNKGYKHYILCIGTSFGYLIGLIILATLNLTKSIKYDNILNIILPMVLVVFTLIVTSLIQNFGWFLEEVSKIELDRDKYNNGIYTYSITIEEHKWSRLKKLPIVGAKLAKFSEHCRKRWNHEKFEFAEACDLLLQYEENTIFKNRFSTSN